MSVELPPQHCRFIRMMVGILAHADPSPGARSNEARYRHLLELEQAARSQGAPEASCRVIHQVVHMARSATLRAVVPRSGRYPDAGDVHA